MLKRFLSFSRALVGRGTFERDMDDELRFHIEARTADLIRSGLTPADAARRARVEFGSMEKHKEESRASFGLRLLDEARGDTRYALRTGDLLWLTQSGAKQVDAVSSALINRIVEKLASSPTFEGRPDRIQVEAALERIAHRVLVQRDWDAERAELAAAS